MAAIFGGVKHGERALPMPEEQKQQLAKLEGAIKEREEKLAGFIAKPALANANSAGGTNSLRPPVNAIQNEELFPPVEARFVRFTVLASNSGEPCIDELEVWTGERNVALATNGTKATASGTLPGYAIHKLEHINDGRVGNGRSWISSEAGRGWMQLEFAQPERIQRIIWGRDREGRFADRVATKYRIEIAREVDDWKLVASSDDREPFTGKTGKPAGPVYRFDDFPMLEAERGRKWLTELEEARQQRDALAKTPMVYAGNFTQPGATYRLHRGDPMQQREPVPPGTLEVFKPLSLATNAPEQQRRLKLANWIGNPENPLTARVLVNRVWQYHFGVGLVDTPNDFGKNGSRPTHPELLDWLASELANPSRSGRRDEAHSSLTQNASRITEDQNLVTSPATRPWSIKHLHRLILTSATWRQSSAPRADGLKADAGSRLLWRFPPRRLEAEAIRDSILAVSGNLDRAIGGPSFFLHNVDRENVYHYHPKETFGPAETRRMVYALKVRMEQDGVFGAFDCPDGSLVMPRRSVSTTPLQALNLFNSGFMMQQAETLARRVEKEAGADVPAQVRRAWQLVFNRAPDRKEAREAAVFINSEGLPSLCRAVLNANEFLFIP
jgi:hypothetical protein